MSQNVTIRIPPKRITCSVDLDALIGRFTPSIFKQVVQGNCIYLKIENVKNESNTIKCKNLDFSRGDGVKIGVFETEIGHIQIYFLATMEIAEIFPRIKTLISTLSTQSKQFISLERDSISGSLQRTDFDAFFNGLDAIDPELKTIFLETFGNKDKTTVSIDSWENISGTINNLFNYEYHHLINIDICFSFDYGNDSVTFAKPELFEAMGLTPSHNPFFSEILNLNTSCISSESGERNKIGRKFKVDKINFYTTWKTIFEIPSLNKTPISSAMSVNSLYNCSITGIQVKTDNIIKAHRNIADRYRSRASRCYPYRCEFRCNLEDVTTVQSLVFEKINDDMFTHVNSADMMESASVNINNFLEHIYPGNSNGESVDVFFTIDMLFESAILEMIYIDRYIKGRKVGSYVHPDLAARINVCTNVEEIAQYIKRYSNFSNLDKKKILKNVIENGFFNRPEEESILMHQMVLMYFDASSTNIHEKIFEAYLFQNKATIESICAPIEGDCSSSIISILSHVFERFGNIKKSTPLMIMARMAGHRFGIPNIVEKIALHVEGLGVQGLYDFKGRRIPITKEVLFLSDVSKRDKLLAKFNEFHFVNETHNGGPEEAEIIRYIHGMYFYKKAKKRFIALSNDFAYSFFFRSSAWLRNRMSNLNKVAKNENNFIKLMHEVLNWEPFNFTCEQRMHYFSSLGINLSNEEQAIYMEIVKLDSVQHYENILSREISFFEIFKASINPTKLKALNSRALMSLKYNNSYSVACSKKTSNGNLVNEISPKEKIIVISSSSEEDVLEVVEQDGSEDSENALSQDYLNDGDIICDSVESFILDENCYVEDNSCTFEPIEDNIEQVADQEEKSQENEIFDKNCIADEKIPVAVSESGALVAVTDLNLETINNSLPNNNSIVEKKNLVPTNEYQAYLLLLYRKYKFRSFYKGTSRRDLFELKSRPEIDAWSSVIDRLCAFKYIYKVGVSSNFKSFYYRCNLFSTSFKPIAQNLVMKYIFAAEMKSTTFTLSVINRKFDSAYRPVLDVLRTYLDCLVERNFLSSEKKELKIVYRINDVDE